MPAPLDNYFSAELFCPLGHMVGKFQIVDESLFAQGLAQCFH